MNVAAGMYVAKCVKKGQQKVAGLPNGQFAAAFSKPAFKRYYFKILVYRIYGTMFAHNIFNRYDRLSHAEALDLIAYINKVGHKSFILRAKTVARTNLASSGVALRDGVWIVLANPYTGLKAVVVAHIHGALAVFAYEPPDKIARAKYGARSTVIFVVWAGAVVAAARTNYIVAECGHAAEAKSRSGRGHFASPFKSGGVHAPVPQCHLQKNMYYRV